MAKPLKNGRSGAEPRHVRLYEWLLASAAWQSLDVYERALYVEFKARYNGVNNGGISFSGDEMAAALNCSNRPADRARDKLISRGFVKVAQHGHFDWKSRGENRSRASTYTLTEHSIDLPVRLAEAATKEFMRWRSPADDLPVEKKQRGEHVTRMVCSRHHIKPEMARSRHPIVVSTSPDEAAFTPSNGVSTSPAYNIPPTEGDLPSGQDPAERAA